MKRIEEKHNTFLSWDQMNISSMRLGLKLAPFLGQVRDELLFCLFENDIEASFLLYSFSSGGQSRRQNISGVPNNWRQTGLVLAMKFSFNQWLINFKTFLDS